MKAVIRYCLTLSTQRIMTYFVNCFQKQPTLYSMITHPSPIHTVTPLTINNENLDNTKGNIIWLTHYNDVIMGVIVSQITSLMIVFSTVYSAADQRKHQSSASLAFVQGIHRGPVNSPHKCFHLMTSSCDHATALDSIYLSQTILLI